MPVQTKVSTPIKAILNEGTSNNKIKKPKL